MILYIFLFFFYFKKIVYVLYGCYYSSSLNHLNDLYENIKLIIIHKN